MSNKQTKGFCNASDFNPLLNAFLQKDQCSSPGKATLKSIPGIITGDPASSLLMEAKIDGHQYKGVLYLVQEDSHDTN